MCCLDYLGGCWVIVVAVASLDVCFAMGLWVSTVLVLVADRFYAFCLRCKVFSWYV